MTTPSILPSDPFLRAGHDTDCTTVRDQLLHSWLEAPGDEQSPAFLPHVAGCRCCLQAWIALEAAARLAFGGPRRRRTDTSR